MTRNCSIPERRAGIDFFFQKNVVFLLLFVCFKAAGQAGVCVCVQATLFPRIQNKKKAYQTNENTVTNSKKKESEVKGSGSKS